MYVTVCQYNVRRLKSLVKLVVEFDQAVSFLIMLSLFLCEKDSAMYRKSGPIYTFNLGELYLMAHSPWPSLEK